MGWVKRLEVAGKLLLATLASVLLWRPGKKRRATARIAAAKTVLLVRIDNRIGEALLTTPLLGALRGRGFEVDLLVHPKARRVLEGHPELHELIAFNRVGIWLGPFAPGIRALRRRGYDVVVDCANWEVPSVTSAIVSRLCGPLAAVLGPAVRPVRWLRTHPVTALEETRNEIAQRMHLLSPLIGEPLPASMSFRARAPTEAIAAFVARDPAPMAIVNPGGRLDWRRIPGSAFAAAARELAAAGLRVVVTYGPGEEKLAREVAESAEVELAPPTRLDELADLMRSSRLSLCNNTGPMHLSVAVGTPTLAFFLKMDAARWGHHFAPHRVVDLTPVVESGGDVDSAAAEAARAFVAQLSAARASEPIPSP